MTSFLRNLWRGGHSKHKKLLDDWNQFGKDFESLASSSPMKDTLDARIHVKYLGSCLMSASKGNAATAEAIKNVIALAKASNKKLQRVILYVSLRGIKVLDAVTEEAQLDISIYRISYCSSDAAYSHVFAFIASNANETMECHAFLCRKRKTAQCATLAIAKTFNFAYEIWQLSHGEHVELPLPPKSELTARIEHDVSRSSGHRSNYARDAEKTSLLIDFDSENTQDDSWLDEIDDSDSKEKKASKEENYHQYTWKESFCSNVDF